MYSSDIDSEDLQKVVQDLQELFHFSTSQAMIIAVNHYDLAKAMIDDIIDISFTTNFLKSYYKEN